MFNKLSEKGLLLTVILVITFSAVVICWIIGGLVLSAILFIAFLVIIYIARSAWITTDSNYRLRRLTISAISIAAIPSNTLLYDIIRKLLKDYASINLPSNDLAPEMMLFLLAILTIVFYFTRDKNGLANNFKPIDKLIEGPSIKQKWESVCRGLESQIRDINRDTQWEDKDYTELEAEVYIHTSKGTKKVVNNLLEAIKKSDDRLFLMIGDPGAGKSVALRKLCTDILKESIKKEYIPIYVDLKEWTSQTDWTKQPPTWQELEAFVKENLKKLNRDTAVFFENYFDVLDENGNLFFVLDSFDEIPKVLETTVGSKLIEDLTITCREFLVGAKQPRSRGILASREYRMPLSEYMEANTTFRVRPFSEAKIELTLLRNGGGEKGTVSKIFKERRDLIPILRNPFILSLFKSYLTQNLKQLPTNQSELYSDYIDNSITEAKRRQKKELISNKEILDFAIQAAKFIFSQSGLQAPISLLQSRFQLNHFDDIVLILRESKIARGNTIGTDIFSFTHRRFYEYFMACDLLKQESIDLPLENIPTDSKWRDTLVLYCEVAPYEQAKKIANYCWEVISKAPNIGERNSKHCLRFLTEAFKGRLDCLIDFHNNLAEFILEQIKLENDPIDIKIAVEALGILNPSDVDKGAIKAFLLGDSWINDTALRSCRHLDSISIDLSKKIKEMLGFEKKYIDTFGKFNLSFILRYSPFFHKMRFKMSIKDLFFSFELSEAFKEFKHIIFWFKIEKWIKIPLACLFLILIFVSLWMNLFNLVVVNLIYYILANIMINIYFYIFITKLIESWYFRKYINFKFNLMPVEVIISIRKTPGQLFYLVVVPALIGVILSFILYFAFKDGIVPDIGYINEILSILVLIVFILGRFPKALFGFFNERKIFKAINKDALHDRGYIASVYTQLNFFLPKFISYLENNIKKVSGEFPDKFLQAGKSPSMTRLIQLEAMWREVEEREESQQV